MAWIGEHTQGLKPLSFIDPERPEPKGSGYLEALRGLRLKPLIYNEAKRPEDKASGYLEATDCSSTVGLHGGKSDALFENIEGDVGLLLGDDERRTEADGVFTAAEQQKAAVEGEVHDAIAESAGGLA